MKECNDKLESRQRRSLNTDIYYLERGPIIILREKEYSLGNNAENEEMGDKRGNWKHFFSILWWIDSAKKLIAHSLTSLKICCSINDVFSVQHIASCCT